MASVCVFVCAKYVCVCSLVWCVFSSQSAKKFAIPGKNLNAQRAELSARCVCVCV